MRTRNSDADTEHEAESMADAASMKPGTTSAANDARLELGTWKMNGDVETESGAGDATSNADMKSEPGDVTNNARKYQNFSETLSIRLCRFHAGPCACLSHARADMHSAAAVPQSMS
jgi:hypothetical protein